jgi:hypothetical protein
MASTGRVPYFFASNETALADIREQAAMKQQDVATAGAVQRSER